MSGYHPIDVHVGRRLRQRRSLLGLSQTALANTVGLTFQQVQKYERGSNRMGSSRLFEFAKVLDVPVSHFFDEMSGEAARTTMLKHRASGPSKVKVVTDPLIKRETLELVRAYYKIRASSVRKHIFAMVKSVSDPGESRSSAKSKKR
jgi:transcriptional regulator with XRE-family HTH domain